MSRIAIQLVNAYLRSRSTTGARATHAAHACRSESCSRAQQVATLSLISPSGCVQNDANNDGYGLRMRVGAILTGAVSGEVIPYPGVAPDADGPALLGVRRSARPTRSSGSAPCLPPRHNRVLADADSSKLPVLWRCQPSHNCETKRCNGGEPVVANIKPPELG